MTGIIRSARRPAGWRAPGPAPATPLNRADLLPRAGEDLCYLSGDWRLLQRLDGHRWSLDDLVTAWLAAGTCCDTPPPRRVLDLGCGIGAVLLMLAWRFPEASLVGVEAQTVSVDLARRSLAWNGVETRCEVCIGDLRDSAAVPGMGAFDLVTGTPPYLPPGTATESPRVQCGPCHIEHRGGIEAYCLTAARAMAATGRFVVCAAARDHARVTDAAMSAGLGIVRRLDVIPRAGKPALFSVYAMRHNAVAGALCADAPLVVRDAAGRRTPHYLALRQDMGMPP